MVDVRLIVGELARVVDEYVLEPIVTLKITSDKLTFVLTEVNVKAYTSEDPPTPELDTVILAVGVGFPINPLNPPSTA